eukprot:m.153956 g.153956  ORF g.153956 m.153956 type:complete len:2367 (-) comp10181_c0_seq1:22-7122(-)
MAAPELEGWFAKKAEKFGKDQRRYFVFTGGAAIEYYVNLRGGKPATHKGSIDVTARTQVANKGRELVITNPDRKWRLVADDAKLAVSWCSALKRHVADLASGVTAPSTAPVQLTTTAAPASSAPTSPAPAPTTTAAAEATEGWEQVDDPADHVHSLNDDGDVSRRSSPEQVADDVFDAIAATVAPDVPPAAATTVLPPSLHLPDPEATADPVIAAADDLANDDDYDDTAEEVATAAVTAAVTAAATAAAAPSPAPVEQIRARSTSVLSAMTSRPANTAVPAAPSAIPGQWFTKAAGGFGKSHSRFFVIRDDRIDYYADVRNGMPTGHKGSIDINESCKFVSNGKELAITSGSRTYHLSGTTVLCDEWARILNERFSAPSGDASVPAAAAGAARSRDFDAESLVSGWGGVGGVGGGAALTTIGGYDASGWLVKKAEKMGMDKRRFFVLQASSLDYYEGVSAAGKPNNLKGSINLSPQSIVTNHGTELKIVNPDRNWLLTARSDADAQAWRERLRANIEALQVRDESATSPSTAAGAPLSEASLSSLAHAANPSFGEGDEMGDASLGNSAAASSSGSPIKSLPNVSAGPSVGPGAGGEAMLRAGDWFSKKAEHFGKAKHRFLRLEADSKLHYYQDVHDGEPVGEKGVIELSPSSKISSNNCDLVINNADRNWVLISAAETTAKSWVKALHQLLGQSEQTLSVSAAGSWFVKKAEKMGKDQRRFFVLDRSVKPLAVAYYEDVQNGQPVNRKGVIPITGQTCVSTRDLELSIANPDRLWLLTAATQETAERWKQDLIAAGATAGVSTSALAAAATGTETGDDFESRLTQMIEMSERENQDLEFDHVRNALENEFGEDLVASHLDEVESVVSRANQSRQDALAFVAAGVWLVKKAEKMGKDQSRFFVLQGNEFAYYADAKRRDQKGTVFITDASEIASSGATVFINNPDRSWQLQAKTAETASMVAQALRVTTTFSAIDAAAEVPDRLSVVTTDPSGSKGSGAFSAGSGLVPGTWFLKKARKVGRDQHRFFILDGQQVNYYEDVDTHGPRSLKGTIALTQGTQISVQDKTLFISNPDRTYELVGNTSSDAETWATALRTTIARAAGGEQESEMLPAPQETHMGAWFVKRADGFGKDQRRYFVLDGDKFSYYERLDGRTPSGFKGAIDLSSSSEIKSADDQIRIRNSDRTWILTAEDDEAAAQWADRLKTAIETIAEERRAAAAAAQDGDESGWGFGEGGTGEGGVGEPRQHLEWFVKKADGVGKNRRRLFALTGAVLRYYVNEVDGVPITLKGQIPIRPSTVVKCEERVLRIRNPEREFILTADTADIAAHWQALLEHAAVKAGEVVVSSEIVDEDGDGVPDKPIELSTLEPLPPTWFLKHTDKRGSSAQKRCFILDGSDIMYYAHHIDGKPSSHKGTIALTDSTKIGAKLKMLHIINADRTWRLEAQSSKTVHKWQERLELVIAQMQRQNMSECFKSIKPAGLRGVWFTKKADGLGKDRTRYFMLDGHRVNYYEDCDEDGWPVGLKGGFDLTGQSLVDRNRLDLTITNPDRVWRLHAHGEDDAIAWYNELVKVVASCPDAPAPRASTASGAGGPLSPMSDDDPLPGAWFTKKADGMGKDKTRYFLLKGNDIDYYADVDGETPKGHKGTIIITADTSVNRLGKVLLIETPSRTWNLTEVSDGAAELWQERIELVIARLKTPAGANRDLLAGLNGSVLADDIEFAKVELPPAWFVKRAETVGKDQRRYFVLEGNEVRYYTNEGMDTHKGTIAITSSCSTTHDKSNIIIRTPERTWYLTAESPEVAKQWAVGLTMIANNELRQQGLDLSEYTLTGWFLKKAENLGKSRQRFFVLKGAQVKYFVGVENGRPVQPRGSITVDPTSHVVNVGKELEIRTEDRTWYLTADSEEVAETWASFLGELCMGGVGGENEIQVLPGRGVWLVKKGRQAMSESKRRFFTLVKGEKSHWLKFNYYKSFRNNRPHEKKGGIRLYNETKLSSVGSNIIINNPDRTWQLTASNEEEATMWVKILQARLDESLKNVAMERAERLGLASNEDAFLARTNERARELAEEREVEPELLAGAWMIRKGILPSHDRRYFFLLREKSVTFYAIAPRKNIATFPEGVLRLSEETTVSYDPANRMLQIDTKERHFALVPDTKDIGFAWFKELESDLAELKEASAQTQTRRRLNSVCLTESPDYGSSTDPEPFVGSWLRGVTAAGPGGKRYFQYAEAADEIRFYDGFADGEPLDQEGAIAVDEDTIFYVDDKSISILGEDQTWQLEADEESVAKMWLSVLQTATNQIPEPPADGEEVEAENMPLPIIIDEKGNILDEDEVDMIRAQEQEIFESYVAAEAARAKMRKKQRCGACCTVM